MIDPVALWLDLACFWITRAKSYLHWAKRARMAHNAIWAIVAVGARAAWTRKKASVDMAEACGTGALNAALARALRTPRHIVRVCGPWSHVRYAHDRAYRRTTRNGSNTCEACRAIR
jgi:hypothetical protein